MSSAVCLSVLQMFVRLFVDENLDRMVPISKQPKEKIQAIIESCSRQFPEFQERARKRIRTYLKSCRRMKKSGMEVHQIHAANTHTQAITHIDRQEITYTRRHSHASFLPCCRSCLGCVSV